MSKLYILFAMIAAISLFAFVVYKYQNDESRISRLIEASKVTEITVTVLDIHKGKVNVLKTISTRTEIDNLVEFANEQVLTRSNLKSDIDMLFHIQDRSALVDLSFYQSGKYLGTLGLGPYDTGKHFLKYRQYYSETECCENKAVVISSKQKKKLLDLIGYSEREFEQILVH